MKNVKLIFLVVILQACSTVKGDFDYHPNSTFGTKYFSGNESYSDAINSYIYCFDNKVNFGKKVKEAKGFNIQHHYFAVYTYSLMGRSNRNLTKLFEDELQELEGSFNPETDAVIIHNFRFETSPNSYLDLLNGYFPGTLYRQNIISYTADINIVSKAELISLGLERAPEPSAKVTSKEEVVDNPAFNEIVVLKNGDILEGVKTTVTAKELIVTDAKGNTTVYSKKEVLSVKKKK